MPFGDRSFNVKRKKAMRQERKKRLREAFVKPSEPEAEDQFEAAAADNGQEEVGLEECAAGPPDGSVCLDDGALELDERDISEESYDFDGEPGSDGHGASDEEERLVRAAQQDQLFRLFEDEDDGVAVHDVGQVEALGNPPVCREKAVEDASNFFVGLQARRDVPHSVLMDVIQYLQANAESVSDLLKTGTLPTYRSMRYKVLKHAPKVMLDVETESANGMSRTYKKLLHFPRKEIETKGLRVIYTHYYVNLEEVKTLHEQSHKRAVNLENIDISIDGIPESKSSGLSIDVLSIRFEGCDNIYSIGIIHPARKGLKGKDEILLRPFLAELEDSAFKVKKVIADAPKRAVLQGLKSHAGTFGCQYCKAAKVNGKFPSSTFRGRPRTDGETRMVADALEAGEHVENPCGVKGPSPLKNIPGLDLIKDIPTEAMHLISLGVVRRMMRCTFNVGPKLAVAHKPADVEPLNRALARVKGISNFHRQPRVFDPAVWKAEEYRNFVLGYWPVLSETAPRGTLKAWLLTVYIVRGLCLPDALYNRLDRDAFETELFQRWYVTYEKAFGVDQCTYNPHNFTHLDKVRQLGPLSHTSALAYEDHYATIKQNYKAGTTSVGTQALQTSLIATMVGHKCKPTYRLKVKVTSKVDDRYIYLSDGRIFLLTEIDEGGGRVLGRRVPHQRVCGLVDGLDFADVLVFRVETARICRQEETIDPGKVLGKVLVVGSYGSVILWSMLHL